MIQRYKFGRGLFCVVVLASVAGCASISSALDADKIDYKTASEKKRAPALDVPPDLTQIKRDDRYAMPGGTVTASDYQQKQTEKPVTQDVAPHVVGTDIRIERAGSQRWLVVKKPAEVLWPEIKTFWQDAGFLINIEHSDTGIMETEWAENRAKLPQDIIRRTLGKVLDSVYSTGELDKFRTRLERAADGSTEVYISHRGAQEVIVGQDSGRTLWTPRPPDPELEAEFLMRLMVRLGMQAERAKLVLANSVQTKMRAKLHKGNEKSDSYVEVDEGFDRVWRRVGLALDRVGFTVEDRDRSKGLYYVRYIDQDRINKEKAEKEKGWFSGWFSSSDKNQATQRYRVYVKGGEQSSLVTVLDNDGKPERSETGNKILTLLHEQLK